MRIDYSLEICQAKKLVKSNLTFSLKGNFSSSGYKNEKIKRPICMREVLLSRRV